MRNIFKIAIGIIMLAAGLIFSFSNKSSITVHAAEGEETVYVMQSCKPQSASYTLAVKETNTIEYTVTYTEILPDDFADDNKYQSSKLQLSDFSAQATDDDGNGYCAFEEITVLTVSGQVCVFRIKIRAGNKAGSAAIICTRSSSVVRLKIEKAATFIDVVKNLLSTSAVLALIITLAVTVIGRSAIKIFRFGVNYKSNFATVERQDQFEASIREELRVSKTEMQDNILKICLREISRETRPLRDIQSLATSLKTDREILNVRLDSVDQKYNEVRKLGDNINQLEQKVNRLQYGDGTSEIRRSAK